MAHHGKKEFPRDHLDGRDGEGVSLLPEAREAGGGDEETGFIPTADAEAIPTANAASEGDGIGVYLCCCCCLKAKTTRKTYFPQPRPVTDVLFAIMWLLNFLSCIAFIFWVVATRKDKIYQHWRELTPFMTDKQRQQVWPMFATTLVTTFAMIAGLFVVLRYATACCVRASVFITLLGFVGVGIVQAAVGGANGVYYCIIWLLLAIMWGAFLYCWRHKFPPTIYLIETAMRVTWRIPGVISTAFLSVLLHALWGTACGVIFVELQGLKLQQSNYALWVTLICLLFFFYLWTAELIKYGVDYVTTSIVGSWVCFFSQDAARRAELARVHGCKARFPTLASFRYAMCNNLGTISIAALLVALIETLKMLVRLLSRDDNGDSGACMMECVTMMVLNCCQAQVEYINRYAIAYSAIFSTSFLAGARELKHLLEQSGKGMQTIYNDEITSMVVFAASLTGGFIISGIVTLVAATGLGIVKLWVVALVAGIFGFLACSAALAAVPAAVSALFILHVSPETRTPFSINWPHQFSEISARLCEANEDQNRNFRWFVCCGPCIF